MNSFLTTTPHLFYEQFSKSGINQEDKICILDILKLSIPQVTCWALCDRDFVLTCFNLYFGAIENKQM